ncbi:beta-ketoacyl synthase, partial [Pseudomonas aeruginosa]
LHTVRHRSFVHAHACSTPANRVTESENLDREASAFGIDGWPDTAVKAYVGHSLPTATADLLISAVGTFKYGILPGIKT